MCVLAVKGKATRRDLGGSKPKKKNNILLALSSVRGHRSHYQVDLGPVVRTLISAIRLTQVSVLVFKSIF